MVARVVTDQTLIKQSLAEKVKDIFVEIEDSVIRDELLSILTTLGQQPLNLTIDGLIEKLVQRVRDLLLKN